MSIIPDRCLSTVVDAAFVGAPPGLWWTTSTGLRPVGNAIVRYILVGADGERAYVGRSGGQWLAIVGDTVTAEVIGEYRTEDRAIVAVNLRLGPPVNPCEPVTPAPVEARDLATVTLFAGRVFLHNLDQVLLSCWEVRPEDTDVSHLDMAAALALDHGFVVTGHRLRIDGWVLTGSVPAGWSGGAA